MLIFSFIRGAKYVFCNGNVVTSINHILATHLRYDSFWRFDVGKGHTSVVLFRLLYRTVVRNVNYDIFVLLD